MQMPLNPRLNLSVEHEFHSFIVLNIHIYDCCEIFSIKSISSFGNMEKYGSDFKINEINE